MSLEGKKIVITGGGLVLNRAIARRAAATGARVVLAGVTPDERETFRGEVGEGIEVCEFDARDVRSLDVCLEQVSPYDHVVATVAESAAVSFVECDPEEARQMFEGLFWAPFGVAQAAVGGISEGGSITLFSGLSACRPVVGHALVAAAHGAIEALVRALALELSPIRVNAISTGPVATGDMDPSRRSRLESILPVRRVGEPSDFADAALFLMESRFVSGAVLHVDGGSRLV